MMHYSIQPRDRILVTCYGFLSFAKDTNKHFAKNTNKQSTRKYNQTLLNHSKQPATDVLKISKKNSRSNEIFNW